MSALSLFLLHKKITPLDLINFFARLSLSLVIILIYIQLDSLDSGFCRLLFALSSGGLPSY